MGDAHCSTYIHTYVSLFIRMMATERTTPSAMARQGREGESRPTATQIRDVSSLFSRKAPKEKIPVGSLSRRIGIHRVYMAPA